MTDQEILEKSIEKSKFDIIKEFFLSQANCASDDILSVSLVYDSLAHSLGYLIIKGRSHSFIDYERIIFSHSFAKAFFGEEKICQDGMIYDEYLKYCIEECGMTEEEAKDDWELDEECVTLPLWQYHLQKIVLCKEPLKYLERFLK